MLNYLTSRDRRVLLIGIIILSLTLIYFIGLEPFIESHQQLKNKVLAEQKNLLWMQQAATEVQRLRQQAVPLTAKSSSQSLFALIDTSIAQSSLNKINKRIEPKNEQELHISFDEVSFTQLIQWLAQLYQQYQIQVSMILLERQQRPDTVKSHITLYRQKADRN